MNEPFFSICISSLNREETIPRTLTSVSRQTCEDFELIIVDCGSRDQTIKQIEKKLDETWFKQNLDKITFESIELTVRTVEDWNEPLKLARGRYVLMLEADDEINEDFLTHAKDVLEQNSNIGIYATGNQIRKRIKTGFIPSAVYRNHVYSLNEVPPPSETIFIRSDRNKDPYLYNDRDFDYCPEFDLIIRIALDGFDGYHDDNQSTFRGPSSNKKKGIGTRFYNDYFAIREKYADEMEPNARDHLTRNTHRRMVYYSAKDVMQEKRITAFCKWSIQQMGLSTFIKTALVLLKKDEEV